MPPWQDVKRETKSPLQIAAEREVLRQEIELNHKVARARIKYFLSFLEVPLRHPCWWRHQVSRNGYDPDCITTIALYWEEKPTSFINEKKWIDNPRITIVKCVGANSWDGKMRWIMITNTTMVVIYKILIYWLVLTDRKSLSGKRPNWPVANPPVVDFHSQPKEMLIPKPLNT